MTKSLNKIIISSIFLAIAIIFQYVGKSIPGMSQLIVGSVVNMILFLTTFICGISFGIGVGALTPFLAFLTGQLPAALGPFIPFIMIGNIVLILTFGLIIIKTNLGQYIGITLASLLKFGFMYLAATQLVKLFMIKMPPKLLIAMMGIPQFITALLGGILAVIFIKILQKRNII